MTLLYYIILIISLLVIVMYALNEYYFWRVCGTNQEQQILCGLRRGPYEMISFGSSYCRYGIFFDKNQSGFNFGIAAQFFYYTDLMLREYAPKCLKKGGKVYLIIADLVFAEVGEGLFAPEKYQLILEKKTLGNEFSMGKHLRLRYPLFFGNTLFKLKIIAHYIIYGLQDDYALTETNPYNEEETLQAAEQRCKDWCSQFHLKDTISSNVSKDLEEIFKKTRALLTGMIQYCKDNEYKPILVVTPVSKLMRNQLSDEFLKKVLYDNINMANIQNVPFLDYLDDERFADYSLYYRSADFLNARGRRLFTKILLEDTEKLTK